VSGEMLNGSVLKVERFPLLCRVGYLEDEFPSRFVFEKKVLIAFARESARRGGYGIKL